MNEITEQTEETVELLTEPLKVQYLVMQPETMKALAKDLKQIGDSAVKSTALISALPTQEKLDNMMRHTVENNMRQTREIVSDGRKQITATLENKTVAQTTALKRLISTELRQMMTELKARDTTPWKMRLKWLGIGTAIGAILSSAVWLWLLMFK